MRGRWWVGVLSVFTLACADTDPEPTVAPESETPVLDPSSSPAPTAGGETSPPPTESPSLPPTGTAPTTPGEPSSSPSAATPTAEPSPTAGQTQAPTEPQATPTVAPSTDAPGSPTEEGSPNEEGSPTLRPEVTATPEPTAEPSPWPDRDEDGAGADVDCDDGDPDVHPGAEERCDGQDEDCDDLADEGAVDPLPWYVDADGDGHGAGEPVLACQAPAGMVEGDGDCDDGDPDVHPGAAEPSCTDPTDYNCDGEVSYEDQDQDGVAACEDCDDGDAAVYPGATERCDGIDNNCDLLIDDEEDGVTGGSTWYVDGDSDGYGAQAVVACLQPEGTSQVGGDCDDSDPALSPETVWYIDYDQDGYGVETFTLTQCQAPNGYVLTAQDCDDRDEDFYPGAPEDDCSDPSDYNCDGSVAYTDGDGDGFAACEDCDDADAHVHPGADEICDGIDNDCDALIDSDDPGAVGEPTWYQDLDGDGSGSSASVSACAAPDGYVSSGGDCDDANNDVNPDTPWYLDLDGDGYGGQEVSVTQCVPPNKFVLSNDDCDDALASVHPGATELCNGRDDNCDGQTDEDSAQDAPTWYLDGDGDLFGDPDASTRACKAPAGYVADATDCDDGRATVYPGAAEICDQLDNDCDQGVDEGQLGMDAACAALSCLDLLTRQSGSPSGVYWILPAGAPSAFQVYCDQATDGGGWTLVASVVDRSYFTGTTCGEVCGDTPASTCNEVPFTSATTAGAVANRTTKDYKSLAYSTVPFKRFLFLDSGGRWASYDIAGSDQPSVSNWYPAGLKNYVPGGIEAHPSHSYPVASSSLAASANTCATLRVSFNVEDSDTPMGGGCHHASRGPGWSATNNDPCYWDDGGVPWTHGAFGQAISSGWRFWLVR